MPRCRSRTVTVSEGLYQFLEHLRGPRTRQKGRTMSDVLLSQVACPECGGDLEEDDDGCIVCTECDFADCPGQDDEEDEDDEYEE